jgi:hypothetical protein
MKEQYLRFIKEQGKAPNNFFEFQKCPVLRKPILTYALAKSKANFVWK